MQMDDIIGAQFTASAIIVWGINRLKNAGWCSFISAESDKLNRLIAIVAAILVGLGVHAEFDQAAGILTVTGLTAQGLIHNSLACVQSFATQQCLFRVSQLGEKK